MGLRVAGRRRIPRVHRAPIRPVVAEAEGRLLRKDLPIQAASSANPFGEAAFGRGRAGLERLQIVLLLLPARTAHISATICGVHKRKDRVLDVL